MEQKARLTMGKASRLTAAALAAALVVAACGQQPAGERPPEPGDRAAARVNGQTIWVSDVKREAVAEGQLGAGDPLDVSSDLFRQVLDEVIDTRVLAAEAQRLKLDRDPAAQRRLAAARDRTLEALLIENVVGKAVTPAAENGLYQEFVKNSAPTEELRLRQIVVASPADAEQVRKLLAGGMAFETLAMQRSRDPATQFKGGDLGTVTTDTLPEAIAAAVKDAKIGQVVGPVKVDQGWALLRVDDRKAEPQPSLDTVRPQIIRFLTYDRIKDEVLRLRDHAKIETLIAPPPQVPGAPTEPASAPPPASAAPSNAAANAAAPAQGED